MALEIFTRTPEDDGAGGFRWKRQGQLVDYLGLDATLRRNAVGSWRLSVPLGSADDALLRADQAAILAREGDTVLFSGPVRSVTEDDASGVLTADGHDENVYVADRIAIPLGAYALLPVNLAYPELLPSTNVSTLFPVEPNGDDGTWTMVAASPGPDDMEFGTPGVFSAGKRDLGRLTPVEEGQTYTVSVEARSDTDVRTVRVLFEWWYQPVVDGPLVLHSASATAGTGVSLISPSGGNTISGSLVVPAGMVAANARASFDGVLGGEVHHATPPTITQSTVVGWQPATTTVEGQGGPTIIDLIDENVGSAAGPRQTPGMVAGNPEPIGGFGAWKVTGQNLDGLVSLVAADTGLTWRIVAGADGRLVPEVAEPQVVPGLIFAKDRRNLLTYQLTAQAGPNAVYTGGAALPTSPGGDPSALIALLGEDADAIDTWGRIEHYATGTSTLPSELARQTAANLGAATGPVSVTLVPIQTAAERFGTDYRLGDTVRLRTRSGVIVEAIIEQVRLAWDTNGRQVVPALGVRNQRSVAQLLRRVGEQDRRIDRLEKLR